jgi:hypothetical protein
MATLTKREKLYPEERRARLFITIGILVIFSIGIFIPMASTKPTVTYQAEVKRPGYEPAPAEYTVEASPHKMWVDYVSAGGWLTILLGLLLAAGGAYWYSTWSNLRARSGTWVGITGFVVGGALLIFLGYVLLVGNVRYKDTLSPAQYDAIHSDPDSHFPLPK